MIYVAAHIVNFAYMVRNVSMLCWHTLTVYGLCCLLTWLANVADTTLWVLRTWKWNEMEWIQLCYGCKIKYKLAIYLSWHYFMNWHNSNASSDLFWPLFVQFAVQCVADIIWAIFCWYAVQTSQCQQIIAQIMSATHSTDVTHCT